MKSDKQLIEIARGRLRHLDTCLSMLTSPDVVRNLDALAEEGFLAVTHAVELQITLTELQGRYVRRQQKRSAVAK